MITDVHAHLTSEEYLNCCRRDRLGGSHDACYPGVLDPIDMNTRLAMMDAAGVQKQLLSPTCMPYSHDSQEAITAARLVNNQYAEIAKDNPERFGFWASLPLPHVEASLAEIDRAFDELGAVGVALGCNCLEHSIADPAFEPIYHALNERGATIFFHPCQTALGSPAIYDWGLTICAGASMEDTVAALHLINRAIPSRYPRLRFIFPHFGGPLAMLLDRLDGQMPRNELMVESPKETAKRFYFDTVGWGSRAALLATVEAFGASQIVTGSDFPILLSVESYKQTFDHIRDSGLGDTLIGRILENADRLLGEAR